MPAGRAVWVERMKLPGRIYERIHRVAVELVRRSVIPSRLFGPAKGIHPDLRAWVDAAAAAGQENCWWHETHEGQSVSRPPARTVGPAQGYLEILRHVAYPATYLASIPRARVVFPSGIVVSPDDRVFEESCSFRRFFLPQDLVMNSLRPVLRPTRLRGDYVTVASRAYPNYSHWTMECLPRLLESPEVRETRILLPDDLTRWHRESLRALGIADHQVQEVAPGCYEVDRLYFPSFVGWAGETAPWALGELRRRIVGSRHPHPGRRVYLMRGAVAHRRVINEAEVATALRRWSFQCADASTLSVADQAEAVADAEVVVAMHGAALTNIVYAPAGTTVVEVLDPAYENGEYYGIATALGQSYWYLMAHNLVQQGARPPRRGHDDVEIPLDVLEDTLDAAIGSGRPTLA